jgi:hypothetical protein
MRIEANWGQSRDAAGCLLECVRGDDQLTRDHYSLGRSQSFFRGFNSPGKEE